MSITQGRGGYGDRVSPIIYDDATASFRRFDWLALALAALDQAGVSLSTLAQATKHARSDIDVDRIAAEIWGDDE